jgi:hypothetical protein
VTQLRHAQAKCTIDEIRYALMEVDLIESDDARLSLLESEREWRVRSVEKLRYTSALSCISRKSVTNPDKGLILSGRRVSNCVMFAHTFSHIWWDLILARLGDGCDGIVVGVSSIRARDHHAKQTYQGFIEILRVRNAIEHPT